MSENATAPPLRLNLGSGQRPQDGFINVDKFGAPDLKWDLEQFPWPWPDNSVGEIVMNHVLEHLGANIDIFFGIIKEMYRVCRDGGIIDIAVPHPRHDDFLGDPTHVRAFTPDSFAHYSKDTCRLWQKQGAANTPLALYLDVDFVLKSIDLDVDEPWLSQLKANKIGQGELLQASRQFNNVVKQIRITWVVKKPR